MKTQSAFSQNIDPYRAGIELAEAVEKIEPEIIFLFTSIHYNGSLELSEAIYEVLDQKNLLLIGCTGDGFYERDMVANIGASILAVNSEGSIHWKFEKEQGVGHTPFETTRKCFQRLTNNCPEARLFFLLSDFRTDASEVVRAISTFTDKPVIGGMAGDNFDMKHCFLYINHEVVTDQVIILALGGNFCFDIFTVHNMNPDGEIGIITECNATTIRKINDLPAMNFVEEAMGKPLDYIDTGTITGNIVNSENPQIKRHRSLLLSKDPTLDSNIHLFGGISEGEHIQLCLTTPDQIIAEIKDVAVQLAELTFQPSAAIVVSCAGRKHLLGNDNRIEIEALDSGGVRLEAIAGFPSLGEIGPVKLGNHYSQPIFHNMTYVLFVFGEKFDE